MLKTAEEVLVRARDLARKRKPMVAIAGAEDGDVLHAVSEAVKGGMVGAILVGNAGKIREQLSKRSLKADDYEIAEADGLKAVVTRAVELCADGKAHILMKGKVPTPDLMKALLAPKAGLRRGRLLSHCAVLELPGFSKLVSFTDGGVVSAPDFSQRLAIIENAIAVSRMIGVRDPRVAILGVANEPTPDIPSTMEAAALARAVFVRKMTPYVEGPLTLGTVFAGDLDGKWPSEVVGEPDIIVSHSIEETNIGVKALCKLRDATFMGVITGAKVPLSLVSRADPPRNKLASLALAAVIAGEEQ